jgi:transaldolase
MQFFIDTADVEEIRAAHDMGLVDGVTTNPSLVAKTGRRFEEIIHEICHIVDGPISAEAICLDYEPMVEEARKLAALHKNIVVKIPLVADGLKAVRTLSQEGVRTNVTLCFSATQALLAAKAGATYISPFVGRLDDISLTGMSLISEILDIYGNYDFGTQVLVASIRNPLHVLEAAQLGAHVATIPYKVMLALVNHPLTDKGIDAFCTDWERVPK